MNRWAMGGAAAFAALTLATPRAEACGGFFCSNQPMDQAGENILFAIEGDGTMTTVVQILYSGEADRFAWILPIPSVPTLSVGTDALFDQLAATTQPRFQLSYEQTGTCRMEPSCWDGRYEDTADPGSPGSDAGAFADAGASGPTVVLREVVGPYDAVVLSGGTAEQLHQWLTDNDYEIPESSIPLIASYVESGHLFVAIRLLSDRSTTEIQPLVMRYSEPEPCVPIRLTAIATVPDMPIIAYFLGDARAVPTNYSLVEGEPNDPGLFLGTRSYQSYLSEAVDAAGGRAFMTDYAGVTPSLSLEAASVADLATLTSPRAFMQALMMRGYTGDSQLLALLTRFMPPPEGMDPQSYYNCLAQSWCSGVEGALDAPGLVAAIDETIVRPRADATAMLARHARTTRLATTMSAAEMTIDPTFRLDRGVDQDVSNLHQARLVTECAPEYYYWSAPQHMVLPDGTEVHLRDGVPYYGDDDDYCDDMRAGEWGPWVDRERLLRTSERSRLRPAGGGPICSAQPGVRHTTGALVALGIVALGIAARRRRSR